MGLRFRQRIKVFPGVHVNVSLGGMSVSMGGPGATVNIGKNMRVRATVGLPGTGLSYQETLHPGTGNAKSSTHSAVQSDTPQVPGWTGVPIEDAEPFEALPAPLMGAPWTPQALIPVQELIIQAHQERQALDAELDQLQQRVTQTGNQLARWDTWWGRWLFKKRIQAARSAVEEAQTAYVHVQELERTQGVPIHWSVDEELQRRFVQFSEDMRSMLHRAQGWHLLGMNYTRGDNRAWISSPQMQRTSCTVDFARPAFFATDDPLHQNTPCLTCADGLTLYFFPTFILVQRADVFGLLPPQALHIEVDDLRVAEHDPAYAHVPTDEYTWHYVNKNGTPDQRYTYNPQVPLLDYQRVTLSAPAQGLHETFLFTGGAYALASWLGVADWYEAREHYGALQALAITPVQWSVRSEPDATYFVAHLADKEVLGFGVTRHADQFWVCLNTEPLGVDVNPQCAFDFWIDGVHLELGAVSGTTRRIGTDDAAFRVVADKQGQDRAIMQQCLVSNKEVLVLVRKDEVPLVRLRLAIADPAPFWDAVEHPAPASAPNP